MPTPQDWEEHERLFRSFLLEHSALIELLVRKKIITREELNRTEQEIDMEIQVDMATDPEKLKAALRFLGRIPPEQK